MYLKRLELVGFKSFAEKTTLEFGPGITAVVGPNGCGKSNVSDAVRWVLGEQSAKMLRGSSMQDVIFNGTDDRKAVGFAEVALTMADTDKVLPVEYNEVTIARRVYRTGESEYYLNKQLCRLKDIHELFLGTGVGSNPYSMIEQGNIDQLISSKPEERRFVFEEAAGITKFKAHKKEALRKLDATEANLLRVQDIIREVKKQINSINRQANKAMAYKALAEELKGLELKNYARKFRQLNDSIRDADGAARDMEYERGKEEKNLSLLEADMSQLRLDLDALSQSLASKNAERMMLESEAERAKNQIGENEQKIEESKRKVEQWGQEIRLIGEKLAEIDRLLGSGDGDFKGIAEERAELSSRVAGKEAEFSARAREIEEIQGKLVEQKSQIVGTLAQESQVKNELVHLQAEEKTLQQEARRLAAEIAENDQARRQHELDLQTLVQLLKEEEARLAEMEGSLRAKQEFYSKSRFELEALDRDVAKKSSLLSEKKSKLELLLDLKSRFEGYYYGVKTILQAARSPESGLKGICGVVADLIQVPREYETAIEVALGARIQNIVTESGDDAKKGVEFLKRSGAGQATFLPLDLLKPGQMYQLPEKWSNGGVIGNACDFIQFDPKYYNVFKMLLGNTILVKDLDSALAVARNREATCQLVTLEGDAINGRGAITGGSNQNKVPGFITRDGQIEELKQAVKNLEAEAAGLVDRRNALVQERDGAEKAVQELQGGLHHQRVKVATEHNERAKIDAAVKQAEENRALFETELKNVEGLIGANGARRQELSRQVDTTVALNLNLQSGLTSVEKDLLERAAAKDRLLHELSELKVQLAQAQEKEKGLAARKIQLEGARADLQRQKEQYASEIEEAVRRSEEAAAAMLKLAGDVEELERRKGGFGGEVEELARKREEQVGRIEAKDEAVRRVRQQLNDWQSKLHGLEIKLAEEKLRRETLIAKVQEEYQTGVETVELDPNEAVDWAAVEERIGEIRRKIEEMGPVNLVAIEELKELEERHAFLDKQNKDLVEAKDQLIQAINKINITTREMFTTTLEQIRENFKSTFTQLFNGGKADIILLDDNPDVLEAGIDIIARPPGKKLTSVSLMSGGERALTAVALLFAIFKVKPSPFCVLDEIDAPLDESNINRFVEMVKGFAQNSQFVVITHNKRTISASDAMYGVTMEESGISKVVSVRFKERDEVSPEDRPSMGFAGR